MNTLIPRELLIQQLKWRHAPKRFFKEFGGRQLLAKYPASRPAPQAVTNILWLDREQYSIPIKRSVATPSAL
jgi:hypothetical protein